MSGIFSTESSFQGMSNSASSQYMVLELKDAGGEFVLPDIAAEFQRYFYALV